MAKILGYRVGVEICEALGLDAENIARVDILLRAGDAAIVEISRYLVPHEVGELKEILKRYELTAKDIE